jgi:hypothetical protein
MHAVIKGLVAALLLGGGFAAGDFFQDEKKQDAQGMPSPEPSAEHKWLAEGEGTFKAEGKMMIGPDQWKPMKGTQTNVMQKGGLWQVMDYKEADGSFVGHGVNGWDPTKKKFVSIWVDSMSTEMSIGEGTLSADKKVLTMQFDMPMGDGKRMKVTETITRKDDKTVVLEMASPAPDGTMVKFMEITYTKV